MNDEELKQTLKKLYSFFLRNENWKALKQMWMFNDECSDLEELLNKFYLEVKEGNDEKHN